MSKNQKKFDKAKKRLRRITWQSGLHWCEHQNAKYQTWGFRKPHTATVSCVCGYSELWMRP